MAAFWADRASVLTEFLDTNAYGEADAEREDWNARLAFGEDSTWRVDGNEERLLVYATTKKQYEDRTSAFKAGCALFDGIVSLGPFLASPRSNVSAHSVDDQGGSVIEAWFGSIRINLYPGDQPSVP